MKAQRAPVAALAPPPADILAHLPTALLVVDRSGRVARANAAAEELLTRSEASLIARGLPPALAALLPRAAEGGGVRAHDVALMLATGPQSVDVAIEPIGERPLWYALTITPLPPAPAPPPRAAGLAETLAHEIKNPLAGIRGAAQLLEAGADADGRELTQLIRDEVDRMARLVDRLESLADTRPIARAPVNLNEVMAHVARLARGFAPGLTLAEEYDPSLPPIAGDRDALVQLILNLVKNAAEALGPAGDIALTTAFRHGQRAAGRPLPIEARVTDSGPGVPPAIAASLFDPFVTARRGGTGIGLALAAKIADDHGGLLDHKREAKRTVFRLRLPPA